jgi:hypothetical protein
MASLCGDGDLYIFLVVAHSHPKRDKRKDWEILVKALWAESKMFFVARLVWGLDVFCFWIFGGISAIEDVRGIEIGIGLSLGGV